MKTYSNILICPVCNHKLNKRDHQYICENKHSFDVSKEGYTNLLLKSSKHSGDCKSMVEARRAFLECNHYKPLQDALIELLKEKQPQIIVDAGCGEGYYTNTIAEHLNSELYAFDMSKNALRYAAKRTNIVHYFLASIFQLPIHDHSVDVILNIFAPSATNEFKRILKKEGILIKVDPGSDHLWELKDLLYEKAYKNEEKQLNEFTVLDTKEIKYTLSLTNKELLNLYEMTPYSFKTAKSAKENLIMVNNFDVTIHFILYTYQG
ncbi:23S rRNA (guanine745-N1)-methyltransferase [Breznakia sp. PF5-3]|nr:23S rRNA (guanine745-N1)-methyltransferase [Breznakia sp. PM6-1]MDF9834725.1 23S rRNA (guanine745-N1)-methyltransferase [Breznakia sp. PF5-3]MDF9836840.1 23S rRNA (guanine745-N1)-methyltransferase [Breznakia sp. PFB2-8]MDF9858857.1 23S rRNA (guanine745-N1)-methyltransferase [Breznakia sp. PH5-24]